MIPRRVSVDKSTTSSGTKTSKTKKKKQIHLDNLVQPTQLDTAAQWIWINGRLDDAISQYKRLLKLHPLYPHVHYKLGYLYLEIGSYENAIKAFNNEMEAMTTGEEVIAGVNRGELEKQKGYLWNSAAGRIEALEQLHLYDQAKTEELALLDAIKDDPYEAYLKMGLLHKTLGLNTRAVQSFVECTTHNRDDPRAIIQQAHLKVIQKRPEDAIRLYDSCLLLSKAKLDPLRLSALIGRAEASIHSGSYSKTMRFAKVLLDELYPYVVSGTTDEDSIEVSEAYLKQNYYHAVYLQGTAMLLVGDLNEAIVFFDALLDSSQNFQPPILQVLPGTRGVDGNVVDCTHFHAFNISLLIQHYNELIHRYGPDALLYYRRASAYLALGELANFTLDLIQCLETDSKFCRFYHDQKNLGDLKPSYLGVYLPVKMLECVHECWKASKVGPAATSAEQQPAFFEVAMVQYYTDIVSTVKNVVSCSNIMHQAQWKLLDCLRRIGRQLIPSYISVMVPNSKNPKASHATLPGLEQAQIGMAYYFHSTKTPSSVFWMENGLVQLDMLNISEAIKSFTHCLSRFRNLIEQIESKKPVSISRSNVEQYKQHLIVCYALTWRAVCFRIEGAMTSARDDLYVASKLFPDNPIVLAQRSLLFLLHGSLESALIPLRRLYTLSQTRPLSFLHNIFTDGSTTCFIFLPPWQSQEPVEAEADQLAVVDEPSVSASLSIEQMEKIYEMGITRIARGKYSSGMKYLESVATINKLYIPSSNLSLLELQQCKDSRTANIRAVEACRKLFTRSNWLQEKCGWQLEAYGDLTTLLKLLPTCTAAYWHRSMLVHSRGNWNVALMDLDKCITTLADSISRTIGTGDGGQSLGAKKDNLLKFHITRGIFHMQEENWDEAITDFTVKGLDHQYYCVRLRSRVNLRLKRYKAALDDLQELVNLHEQRQQNDAAPSQALILQAIVDNLVLANFYLHEMLQLRLAKRKIKDQYAIFPIHNDEVKITAKRMIQRANARFDVVADWIEQLKNYERNHPLDVRHSGKCQGLLAFCQARAEALVGKSNDAIFTLSRGLQMCPDFHALIFLRGTLRLQKNLAQFALSDFLIVQQKLRSYPQLLVSIGICYFELGKIQQAIIAFTEALEEKPNDLCALYCRGCCLQESLALENAIADFDKVIRLSSQYAFGYFQRSYCHVLRQDIRQALEDITLCLEVDPTLLDAVAVKAYCYFELQMHRNAIELYTKLIDKAVTCERVAFRGLAYLALDNKEKAALDFHTATAIDSNYMAAYLFQACCYSRLYDLDGLQALIEQCLPLIERTLADPAFQSKPTVDHKALFTTRHDEDMVTPAYEISCEEPAATTDVEKAKDDEAPPKRDLRLLFRQVIKRLVFQVRVAKAIQSLTSKQSVEQAEQALHCQQEAEKLMKSENLPLKPQIISAKAVVWMQNALGMLCVDSDQLRDALGYFTAAIRVIDHDAIAHYNRGNVYMQMGTVPSAVNEYNHAIASDPNFYQAYNNLGIAYLQVRRFEESIANFEKALALVQNRVKASTMSAPSHRGDEGIILFNLGNACYDFEQLKEAYQYYTQALSHVPDLVPVLVNRSCSGWKLNKYDQVLKDCSLALALNPKCVEALNNRVHAWISTNCCYEALVDLKHIDSLYASSDHSYDCLRYCERWQVCSKVGIRDFIRAIHELDFWKTTPLSSSIPIDDLSFFDYHELIKYNRQYTHAFEQLVQRSNSCPARLQEYFRETIGHLRIGDAKQAMQTLVTALYVAQQHLQPHLYFLAFIWRAQIEYYELDDIEGAIKTLQHFLLPTQRKSCLECSEETKMCTELQKERHCMQDRKIEFWSAPRISSETTKEYDGMVHKLHHKSQQLRKSSLSEAIAQHEKEDLEDPNYVQWQNIRADGLAYLGNLCQLQKQYDGAVAAYREALLARPDHIYAMLNLAVVLQEKDQFVESIEYYAQIFQSLADFVERNLHEQEEKKNIGLLNFSRDLSKMLPLEMFLKMPQLQIALTALADVLTQYFDVLKSTIVLTKRVVRLLNCYQGKIAVCLIELSKFTKQYKLQKQKDRFSLRQAKPRFLPRRPSAAKQQSEQSPQDITQLDESAFSVSLKKLNEAIDQCTQQQLQKVGTTRPAAAPKTSIESQKNYEQCFVDMKKVLKFQKDEDMHLKTHSPSGTLVAETLAALTPRHNSPSLPNPPTPTNSKTSPTTRMRSKRERQSNVMKQTASPRLRKVINRPPSNNAPDSSPTRKARKNSLLLASTK